MIKEIYELWNPIDSVKNYIDRKSREEIKGVISAKWKNINKNPLNVAASLIGGISSTDVRVTSDEKNGVKKIQVMLDRLVRTGNISSASSSRVITNAVRNVLLARHKKEPLEYLEYQARDEIDDKARDFIVSFGTQKGRYNIIISDERMVIEKPGVDVNFKFKNGSQFNVTEIENVIEKALG